MLRTEAMKWGDQLQVLFYTCDRRTKGKVLPLLVTRQV